jgi:hypothetical protein
VNNFYSAHLARADRPTFLCVVFVDVQNKRQLTLSCKEKEDWSERVSLYSGKNNATTEIGKNIMQRSPVPGPSPDRRSSLICTGPTSFVGTETKRFCSHLFIHTCFIHSEQQKDILLTSGRCPCTFIWLHTHLLKI